VTSTRLSSPSYSHPPVSPEFQEIVCPSPPLPGVPCSQIWSPDEGAHIRGRCSTRAGRSCVRRAPDQDLVLHRTGLDDEPDTRCLVSDSGSTDWTEWATRVLASNSGPMTLGGTNSYVLRAPSSDQVVVVDPGPAEATHLRALTQFGEVELILLTHHHADHSEGADRFSRMTGAPIRAALPELCREAPPLADGEIIRAAGCELLVLATPGHTEDSICLVGKRDGPLDDPARNGAVITGDTILGHGSTVLLGGTTSLRDYLKSLELLESFGDAFVLPGHGDPIWSVRLVAQSLREHRQGRLTQVAQVLEDHSFRSSDAQAVDLVLDQLYSHLTGTIRGAAVMSVRAQLAFLTQEDAKQ
jgi:glyoxylase-like metal-dependent hydrolase (beta-lactamase superfamily II)